MCQTYGFAERTQGGDGLRASITRTGWPSGRRQAGKRGWVPLFQQSGCLAAIAWPFVRSEPVKGLCHCPAWPAVLNRNATDLLHDDYMPRTPTGIVRCPSHGTAMARKACSTPQSPLHIRLADGLSGRPAQRTQWQHRNAMNQHSTTWYSSNRASNTGISAASASGSRPRKIGSNNCVDTAKHHPACPACAR